MQSREQSAREGKWNHWVREFNKRIPEKPNREFGGILIREMEGERMIKYLRHLERTAYFAGRTSYLRAAVYRKLKQYKGVEWDNHGIPIKTPKRSFNYWEKLYPELYL